MNVTINLMVFGNSIGANLCRDMESWEATRLTDNNRGIFPAHNRWAISSLLPIVFVGPLEELLHVDSSISHPLIYCGFWSVNIQPTFWFVSET